MTLLKVIVLVGLKVIVLLTVGLPYEFYTYCFFLEIFKKKKALKMTSQLVIFRAFLFIFFFRPADPRSEKKSCKSTNKKILA